MIKIIDETVNIRRIRKKLGDIKKMIGEVFPERRFKSMLHSNTVSCSVYNGGMPNDDIIHVFHYRLSELDCGTMKVKVYHSASFEDYRNALEFANRYEKRFDVSVTLKDDSGNYVKGLKGE